MALRYVSDAGPRLRWRAFDDEHVVYDVESGDTHLLDEAGARVLNRLLESPASFDDLLELMAGDAAADERRTHGVALSRLLRGLESKRLARGDPV